MRVTNRRLAAIASASDKGTKKKKKKKDPNRPSKPLTSYIRFMNEKRSGIRVLTGLV